MLTDVLHCLCCPHCTADLAVTGAAGDAATASAGRPAGEVVAVTVAGASLRCANGHTFDIARQGYVTLVPGRTPGDSAAMVAARAEFLSAGHYQPVVAAVVAAASGVSSGAAGGAIGGAAGGVADGEPGGAVGGVAGGAASGPTGGVVGEGGCVLDLGAGTGHYLAAVLDQMRGRVGIALEISKPALKRAARAHPRLGAIGADTWARLPIRDGAVSVVLNVFAPRNAAELARVLAPDGRLVVVAPTPAHLRELVAELDLLTVGADKAERVEAALPGFQVSAQDVVEFTMSLPHDEVLALVGMGPSAWHVAADELRERVTALPAPVTVTASVTVTTYVKGA